MGTLAARRSGTDRVLRSVDLSGRGFPADPADQRLDLAFAGFIQPEGQARIVAVGAEQDEGQRGPDAVDVQRAARSGRKTGSPAQPGAALGDITQAGGLRPAR